MTDTPSTRNASPSREDFTARLVEHITDDELADLLARVDPTARRTALAPLHLRPPKGRPDPAFARKVRKVALGRCRQGEAQAWVTRIAHAEDLEPPIVVRAALSRGLDALAALDEGVIAVRAARPTQLTLLHEIAHLLGAPGHGPYFRTVYGDLIARYLSPLHAEIFARVVDEGGARR